MRLSCELSEGCGFILIAKVWLKANGNEMFVPLRIMDI